MKIGVIRQEKATEVYSTCSIETFLERVKKECPDKNIWCYTGYTFDKDLTEGGKAFCEATAPMLSMIDVLVDGEFVEELKDIRLSFRGSSNQRIIDVKKSLAANETVLYPLK